MLDSTRFAVQRHGKPSSIKTRDMLAMVVASAGLAKRNFKSEFIIANSHYAAKAGSCPSAG